MARAPYEHGEDWGGTDLELIESDERLPWLESEDEDEREAGFATSRLVMIGARARSASGNSIRNCACSRIPPPSSSCRLASSRIFLASSRSSS